MRCSVDGGRGPAIVAAVRELADELRQQGPSTASGSTPCAAEELTELLQIRAVGLERVARESALELEVGEKVERELVQTLGGTSGNRGHAG